MSKNIVKKRLETIGKSQGWLSRELDIKREYVSRLCNQRIPNPGVGVCLKIARVLLCKVEDLWKED